MEPKHSQQLLLANEYANLILGRARYKLKQQQPDQQGFTPSDAGAAKRPLSSRLGQQQGQASTPGGFAPEQGNNGDGKHVFVKVKGFPSERDVRSYARSVDMAVSEPSRCGR